MTCQQRRAAILKAASRLFSEKGFHGATTRALAKAVGVSEPVLYEHFPSKRDLYCTIVEAKAQEGMARAEAMLQPPADARDDRRFFATLARFILDRHEEDPGYVRLLLSVALEDPELGRTFYERQRPAREMLVCYIRQRIAEGAFREVNPALAARAFLGMVILHAQWRVLYDDRFPEGGSRTEVIDGMVDIFLKGIGNQRDGGK